MGDRVSVNLFLRVRPLKSNHLNEEKILPALILENIFIVFWKINFIFMI